MQNKANSKTEVRKQNTEDSKISAKSTPKLRFSVPDHFFYNCRESSTNWPCFMQNKANLRKSQMNVNKVLTKDYENKTLSGHGKNKPNSKPIKANLHFTAENTENLATKTQRREEKKDLYHKSWCLSAFVAMNKLCKTKPISEEPR